MAAQRDAALTPVDRPVGDIDRAVAARAQLERVAGADGIGFPRQLVGSARRIDVVDTPSVDRDDHMAATWLAEEVDIDGVERAAFLGLQGHGVVAALRAG